MGWWGGRCRGGGGGCWGGCGRCEFEEWAWLCLWAVDFDAEMELEYLDLIQSEECWTQRWG